jgi:hypothetical protein
MVADHWVEVVAVEASASGSSDVGLENLAAASETESGALILAILRGNVPPGQPLLEQETKGSRKGSRISCVAGSII